MSARPAALVTGSAKRLGRHIALYLAHHGWDVVVHYGTSHDQAQQTVSDIQALGAQAVALQADLAAPTACQDLVPRAVAVMPKLTALINSASIFDLDTPQTATAQDMQRHYQIHTIAPLLLSQALYSHLQVKQAHGVVVNMLDQKLWNLNSDFLSYTLSKDALRTLTTLLAKSFSPTLRVMGVAPGLTLESHLTTADKFAQLQQHKLTPNSQGADDVAAAVLFALTNASMTGSHLLVDYGQHLMPFERDFSLM